MLYSQNFISFVIIKMAFRVYEINVANLEEICNMKLDLEIYSILSKIQEN